MVLTLKLWSIFFLLTQHIFQISASTHWVVTENGRIQAQLDSPYHLRRPYDLLALLDQETRRVEISTLYQDLVARKSMIDQKWSGLEGASDVENRIYSQEVDCLSAGRLLSEIDLYPSIGTTGLGRSGINLDFSKKHVVEHESDYLVPDCTRYSKLHFSMASFEHLSGMAFRKNVSSHPEKGLENLMPVSTVQQFGHEISIGLSKNRTSWLFYNLGIIYWRIKGDAPQALECGRRAVHYAPRRYRDIALLNLASTFHQARRHTEAAVILHAAVDHAPTQPLHYYALGNVYTALAEYNRSLACYNNILKLQPSMQEAATLRHAIMCHQKLEKELLQLHESLQDILTDLHDYHSQQQQWVRLQERLTWEQAPFEVQFAGYPTEKLSTIMANRGQRCTQKKSDGSEPVISCDFNDNKANNLRMGLQRLLRNVESETQKISEHMSRGRNGGDVTRSTTRNVIQPLKEKINVVATVSGKVMREDGVNMPPMVHQKYPSTMPISTDKYFDVRGWPSKKECIAWNMPIREQDELDVPVFLPPENKGYQITKMLTDYIGLPWGTEHDLPWYPPICEYPEVTDSKNQLPISLRQAENNPLKVSEYLRQHLLSYVNGGKGEEAEIGQRIISAMHKKTGPSWVLATLASLYWRVRSNTRKALNCLEVAFQTVPKDYTDVILISYGSILHQHGLVEDAIKFAMLAFKVNYAEPSTNFLLALLHYTKNNPILAMYYMKNTLRVDPGYYEGRAEKLLKTWACRIKLGNYEEVSRVESPEDGMCDEKESFNGEGMICSANGEQCKTATIQCFRTDNGADGPEPTDPKSLSKVLSDPHCDDHKPTRGRSVLSSLISEGSGNEPDQSQLERLKDTHQSQAFHMRISLGEEKFQGRGRTGGGAHDAVLHVFDKSGTYPLSPENCRNIKDADWLQFSSMWQSIAARDVDVSPYLKPITTHAQLQQKPFCSDALPATAGTLDHLTVMVLRNRLPNSPEMYLAEWLGLIAGDQDSTIREIGAKISIALQENTTSWILATAAALYWRVIGNTEEAITCLRHALTYVPNDMKDIPLISLANVLVRIGFHSDALEVAYLALESHPDFVVNHFAVGNIHTTMGDLEKAISFYRSALALEPNFEPARNRLQAILCTLLFDENGALRESMDGLPDN